MAKRPPSRPALEGSCDHCGGVANHREDGVLRCACGSLLARQVPGGIELKCRRCKRTVVVPLEPEEADVAG